MVKAIFFDIDGTLISFKTHRVPQSTRRAIEILRTKGIKIFIATGRSAHQFTNLEGIDFDGYVTLNGAYCLTADSEVMFKKEIPQSDIQSLIAHLDEHPFPCTFSTEEGVFINFYNHMVDEVFENVEVPRFPIVDINEIIKQDIYQISAFMSCEGAEPLLNKILPHCEATSWHPIFMDIIARGCSKQAGIDQVLNYYGMDLSESMCFGDGGNDVSMLQHTPISVAMGNADDDVKQYATYVTSSVDEDGVWNALKHFNLI